jgi:hypothetical protein
MPACLAIRKHDADHRLSATKLGHSAKMLHKAALLASALAHAAAVPAQPAAPLTETMTETLEGTVRGPFFMAMD